MNYPLLPPLPHNNSQYCLSWIKIKISQNPISSMKFYDFSLQNIIQNKLNCRKILHQKNYINLLFLNVTYAHTLPALGIKNHNNRPRHPLQNFNMRHYLLIQISCINCNYTRILHLFHQILPDNLKNIAPQLKLAIYLFLENNLLVQILSPSIHTWEDLNQLSLHMRDALVHLSIQYSNHLLHTNYRKRKTTQDEKNSSFCFSKKPHNCIYLSFKLDSYPIP